MESVVPVHAAKSLSRQCVLEELYRILTTREFSRSPQMSRFLRFVVEETLEGRGETLKESVIGLTVYGKGTNFDPRTNSIVRVQANKLRAHLAAYYASAGSNNAVRIDLPKGAYVPTFLENGLKEAAVRSLRKWRLLVLAAFAPFVLGAVLLTRRSEPLKPVVPVRRHLTYDTGWNSHPVVSRDGLLLAFASDRPDGGNVDIWIRDLRGQTVRRLTTHPAIDWSPDFSPDGRSIVFRSFRNGGGIYRIPVAGGPETLVAARGFNPRFSPDGNWIAYIAIEDSGNGRVYVVSTEGGAHRRAVAQDFSSDCPIWSPDGTGLLFNVSESESKHDWWFVPFKALTTAPVPAKRAGFREARVKLGDQETHTWTCPGDWLGREMFYANEHLYRMLFAESETKAPPEGAMILAGPGIDSVRAIEADHRSLVFAKGETSSDFWAVPLGPREETGGEPIQLTSDASVRGGFYGTGFSVSPDGRFLVFPTHNAGPGSRILVHDVQNRTDYPLSPDHKDSAAPVVSPRTQHIAWLVKGDRKQAIFMSGVAGTDVREICSDCGIPRAWSPDEAILLYTNGPDLWSLEISSGIQKPVLKQRGYEVTDAGFSPDGRWVALVVGIAGKSKLQGVLAPFKSISDEKQWITIAEEDYHLALQWAAQGDIVYYLSRRDDFRCLYGQRLRASDKQPVGPPIPIRHFHSYRNYPNAGSHIAVALDKVVLRLSTRKSNIWEIDLPNRGR